MPCGRAKGLDRIASPARDAGSDIRKRSRRFFGGAPRSPRNRVALLQARRKVCRSDRRAGRQADGLRDRLHLWCRATAAVPRRVSRRTSAGVAAGLGFASGRAGRTTLVSSLRGCHADRPTALDRHLSKLESAVRGMPLDQSAQELQPGDLLLQHYLHGNKCRLRGLPRAGRAARGVGEGTEVIGGSRQGTGDIVAQPLAGGVAVPEP